MPRIKFVQDYRVQAEGEESFKKDQEVDLSEDSCLHFVSRGVAEYAAKASQSAGDKKPATPGAAKKSSAKASQSAGESSEQ